VSHFADPLDPILGRLIDGTFPPFEWVVGHPDLDAAVHDAWEHARDVRKMIDLLARTHDRATLVRAAAAAVESVLRERPHLKACRYVDEVARLARGEPATLPSREIFRRLAATQRNSDSWEMLVALVDVRSLPSRPAFAAGFDALTDAVEEAWKLCNYDRFDQFAPVLRARVPAPTAAAVGFAL